MFRGPTEHELVEVFPKASRGWESQREEWEGWVEVQGRVPEGLQGTFLRNGPGLTDVFGTPLKHPIDGDGMVVALTFCEGKVHFRNRFVQTWSHREETAAQRMLFNGNMGSRVPGGTKSRKMRDPAHTNVFYWGGKLLACHEYALPHALDPRTLETLGPDDLGGALGKVRAFSAHFRVDVQKGLLVGVGFRAGGPQRPPVLGVFEFDRAWALQQEVELSVEGLNYAHDFIMTPDYYVFHMTPFVDTSLEAAKLIRSGKKAPGELMSYNPALPSRMVVVDRYVKPGQERRIRQYDTEPCHIYHFQNAVQEDAETITFGATCMPPGFNMDWQNKVFLSNTVDAPGLYHDYRIDMRAAKCVRTLSPKVAARSNEFPIGHPYRQNVRLDDSANKVQRPRFVYLMAGAEGVTVPFTDVVKYDTLGNCDAVWHSEGVVGEPVFVPRLGRASAEFGADDDGWIITQLYHPGSHKVDFVVLDAQNLAAGPVCRIRAPLHVPYSFHGTFTPEVFVHPPPRL